MENPSKTTEFVKVRKVKPSQVGQKCPVCSGFGTLKFGKIKCHGCKGKGFILVPAEEVLE
jgi:hypothetical protein